jgi:hypothetical protein
VSEFGSIEKLRREHQLDEFDCGRDELNRFLKRQAWANQQSHSAQTYVLAREMHVLGYYSLAAGAVAHDEAPERVRIGSVTTWRLDSRHESSAWIAPLPMNGDV